MRITEQFSITLPHDMAKVVRKKIKSGAYASVSEVVREGVRTLVDRDAALEKWLRTEAVASYDYMKAHPEAGIPMEKAFARINANVKKRRSARRS
jgi:antitoxin ParD1/3/4